MVHRLENSGSWAQPLIDIFVAQIELCNAGHWGENAAMLPAQQFR